MGNTPAKRTAGRRTPAKRTPAKKTTPKPVAVATEAAEPARPAPRLRVVHVELRPVLAWDDGTELSPGPTGNLVAVPLSMLSSMADAILGQVEAMQVSTDEVVE
jgi:hypothetical protein